MLHRYGSVDYILKLPYQRASAIISKALEKEVEGKLWEQYLTIYPLMIKQQVKHISFQAFKERAMQKPSPKVSKTTNELIEETLKIREMDLKTAAR